MDERQKERFLYSKKCLVREIKDLEKKIQKTKNILEDKREQLKKIDEFVLFEVETTLRSQDETLLKSNNFK